MFIYNSWYVAALSREIEAGKVFARTILNQPIAFYRKTDGSVAALEDRCCHRLAPLSLGSVVEDAIQCGYHGFCFDGAGQCVKIPGQAVIPAKAKVRAFPVIERHGFIWVWPGAPELAVDQTSIPDELHVLDSTGYDSRASYVHVKSGYRLIVDNLQDASHAEFVHVNTLKVEGLGETMRQSAQDAERSYKFEIIDGNIRHNWRVTNTPGGPAFVKGLCLQKGLDYETVKASPVNWILETTWYPPGIWTFKPTTYLPDERPEEGASWVDVIVATPETEHTSHYFWGDAQNFDPQNAQLTDFYHEATEAAFAEDVAVFEAQQRIMGPHDVMDFDVITASGDAASIQARRILDSLKAKEGAYLPDSGLQQLAR